MWDVLRECVLVRARPGGGPRLVLVDHGWSARRPGIEGRLPSYELEDGRRVHGLEGVAWADWAPGGRLAVATHDGRLELRELARVVSSHDLGALKPDPGRAPEWAQRW
jgi:hypothetical protein